MSASAKTEKTYQMSELISGLLVLVMLLAELCFFPLDVDSVRAHAYLNFCHVLLSLCVWVNAGVLVFHVIRYQRYQEREDRFYLMQLIASLAGAVLFAGTLFSFLPPQCCWLGLLTALIVGVFSLVNLGSYIRSLIPKSAPSRNRTWNSAVIYFVSILSLILASTLVLMTPGACVTPVSFTDAFFMSASAASNTGLATVLVSDTFTWLGRAVLMFDMQLGAMGVMTFTYFVLLMVGKRMAVKDSVTMSSIMEQESTGSVPAMIRTVILVSVIIETLGAVLLYFCWQGNPDVPQDPARLAGFALFHSVSTFCNSGLTLFANNFAEQYIQDAYAAQAVMMGLILAGTMGFGVYLEVMTRLKRRMSRQRNPLRWSTHAWFALRAMLIITAAGTVCLTLIGWLEPSGQNQGLFANFWDGMWNCIGRSTGINRTIHSDYGPVYNLTLSLLMFIGGNPAGTGGGVFAPVFAICVLEVMRVLRGEQDVVIYNRCISRSTVDRAMSTLVLCILWIVLTSMALLVLEPHIAARPQGLLQMLHLAVSAFATSGYSLFDPCELSSASKYLLSLSMMFGRVGMFTAILIFIKPREPAPVRYPKTRLPLT